MAGDDAPTIDQRLLQITVTPKAGDAAGGSDTGAAAGAGAAPLASTTPQELQPASQFAAPKGSIVVEINGEQYKDFVAFSFRRSVNESAGGGSLVMSWPGAEHANAAGAATDDISVFDTCVQGSVFLEGQLLAVFRVTRRTSHGTPNNYQMTIELHDITSDAVLSHVLDHPTNEEIKKTPKQIMERLLQGFPIKIIDMASFQHQIKRFVIGGETIDRAMRRATRDYGLMYFPTNDGNFRLQKTGDNEGNGQALVIGRNFVEWQTSRKVIATGNPVFLEGATIPDDQKRGKDAEEIGGLTKMPMAKCKRRINVKTDGDHTPETLKDKAIADGRRRQMQELTVTLILSTWADDSGKLWAINKLHHVKIPVDEIDDDLYVQTVIFELTKDKRRTTMTLTAQQGKGGGSVWSSTPNDGRAVTGPPVFGAMQPGDI